MLSVAEMEYHPTSEELVKILCSKTQNSNPLFFRVLVGYYFSLVASAMRCQIATPDRGDIPVNLYAINLGTSGSGKGHSTSIMENEVIHLFRGRFMEETFPVLAENNLPKLANKRAVRKSCDPDEELVRVQKEFENLGNLVFSFDSGTPAAVKQMRHKLLMADAGAVNLQIDEIGSNLLGNIDVLNTFLELYDLGAIKEKITKNTSENVRGEQIIGRTPTNMMLFGTPAKLLNGSKVEEELYSMLETGYARRCFFGYSRAANKMHDLTAEQVFDLRTDKNQNQFLEDLADQLEHLADMINVNKRLVMSKETTLTLIEYHLKCEREAEAMPEHEEIRKAELSHRYFKALKLAGAYAFVDDSPELTDKHLYYAIKLAEESGLAFEALLTRDRNYVKLAKYIAAVGKDITQADLVEDLPFYKGPISAKQEMMQLAIAYGYKNNIIIKKSFDDGIEFLRGESLKPTDLDQMILTWSDHEAYRYQNEVAPFDQLHVLTQAPGLHWVNHHLKAGDKKEGHRNEENCMPGFNLLVIDVDGGIQMSTAKLLLKDYKAMFYTTKRHTDEENRFRIIFPMNYELKLDAKDFKEFMDNIYEWLPFPVDAETGQRSRKWMSHNAHYEYIDGAVLDVLPFIPKTVKNEERKTKLDSQQSLDALERWMLNNTGDGNRNNMLLRFGLMLVEAGFSFNDVNSRVKDLNDKLADKLDEVEIMSTIMISVTKAIAKRGA